MIDGQNITTDDEHMWLIPFSSGAEHWLTAQMPTAHTLTGLRVWNYNKSPEDTYRGVRPAHCFCTRSQDGLLGALGLILITRVFSTLQNVLHFKNEP